MQNCTGTADWPRAAAGCSRHCGGLSESHRKCSHHMIRTQVRRCVEMLFLLRSADLCTTVDRQAIDTCWAQFVRRLGNWGRCSAFIHHCMVHPWTCAGPSRLFKLRAKRCSLRRHRGVLGRIHPRAPSSVLATMLCAVEPLSRLQPQPKRALSHVPSEGSAQLSSEGGQRPAVASRRQ